VGGTYSTHGTDKCIVGKAEGKRSLGRSWRRCEVNITIDLQEM